MGLSKSNICKNCDLLRHYYHFIVNLNIADSNGYSLIETIGYLVIDLGNGPGHHTAILILRAASTHGEGFSCTCLPVAQDSTIVALYNWGHKLLSTCFIDFILTK